MYKKIAAVILAVVLVFSASLGVSAQSVNTPYALVAEQGSDIQPRYSYTSSTITSLNISSGTATCTTRLVGYSGTTTKIVIKMTLQKKTLLWWSTEESWSTTINAYMGSLTKTASVGSGTYRVKAEFTVYSGSNSEEITTYSQEQKV